MICFIEMLLKYILASDVMHSNPNLNVVGFQQYFVNLKSDGFSDSFGFGISFRFGKPKFIRHNLLLTIQK